MSYQKNFAITMIIFNINISYMLNFVSNFSTFFKFYEL